jgi:hypothetical protein
MSRMELLFGLPYSRDLDEIQSPPSLSRRLNCGYSHECPQDETSLCYVNAEAAFFKSVLMPGVKLKIVAKIIQSVAS